MTSFICAHLCIFLKKQYLQNMILKPSLPLTGHAKLISSMSERAPLFNRDKGVI